jgi:hypothetical protein
VIEAKGRAARVVARRAVGELDAGRRRLGPGGESGATRLGFSLLLKFFELEGQFPDGLEEVPSAAMEYVVDLVKVPATDFAKPHSQTAARTGGRSPPATRPCPSLSTMGRDHSHALHGLSAELGKLSR